jgi:hypothetical protein
VNSEFIALTLTYPSEHMLYIHKDDISAFAENMTEMKGVLGTVVYVGGREFFVKEPANTVHELIYG